MYKSEEELNTFFHGLSFSINCSLTLLRVTGGSSEQVFSKSVLLDVS